VEPIFCISAGQLLVKKTNNKINRQNRYLNYGLLSLATTLKNEGWKTTQIQGHFDDPAITLKKCITGGFGRENTMPLLISIPSFYAISWVNLFIENIKNINNRIKIIIGGRWVISNQLDLMRELVPQADIIIPGLVDNKIGHIVRSNSRYQPLNITDNHHSNHSQIQLDYSILVDRSLYQPSLEVSRGCGMGCSFCQEKDEPLLALKPPLKIINEAQTTLLDDNLNTMNLYFESSMFIPNKNWIDNLIANQVSSNTVFNWRTESRVDAINIKHIEKLSKSGLKILDLGLESASHTQLLKMKKTKNPTLYLSRASDLLKKCYEYGIYVKVNILLSAGETQETILETKEWLASHRKYIKGISAGPVIIFGWQPEISDYYKELSLHGASMSNSPATGIYHLNLSNEIDHEESIAISNDISREFMSSSDYFFLKSFSYFSRDYRYSDFINDLNKNNSYSFRIDSLTSDTKISN